MKDLICKYFYFGAIAYISLLFTSCISSADTNYLQAIPENYGLVDFEEYKLQVRDEIACQIFSNSPQAKEMFQGVISQNMGTNEGLSLYVYEDGKVILPFFGSVEVVNLTLQEAEVHIQNLLKESFNDVQVKLVQQNNYFYILSSQSRGQYRVYKENMTIYQALAISGQTTNRMDISKVYIIRKNEIGEDVIKTFDLRSQDVVQSEFYFIKPNDQIYFSTSQNAFFNVTSAQTFISVVVSPLMYLFVTLKLKN